MIGHNSVSFFRHAPIERAESGFDMGDGDTELGGSKGSGECGVRIAVYQHAIGFFYEECLFDGS